MIYIVSSNPTYITAHIIDYTCTHTQNVCSNYLISILYHGVTSIVELFLFYISEWSKKNKKRRIFRDTIIVQTLIHYLHQSSSSLISAYVTDSSLDNKLRHRKGDEAPLCVHISTHARELHESVESDLLYVLVQRRHVPRYCGSVLGRYHSWIWLLRLDRRLCGEVGVFLAVNIRIVSQYCNNGA